MCASLMRCSAAHCHALSPRVAQRDRFFPRRLHVSLHVAVKSQEDTGKWISAVPPELRKGKDTGKEVQGKKPYLKGSRRPTRRNKEEGGRPRKTLQEIAALPADTLLHGRVRVVTDCGLIVKLRAESDAFLHESELGEWGPLANFKRGTEIRAHVHLCKPEQCTLKLTLKKGGYVVQRRIKPADLAVGGEYPGTVKRFKDDVDEEGWSRTVGAFVDFGCQLDGYIEGVDEVPPPGSDVVVRILPGVRDEEEIGVRRRIPVELAGARGEAKPDAGSGKGKGGRPTKGDKGGVKEKDEEEGDDLYDKYAYLDEF